MRITEITCGRGYTFNTGNFESERFDGSVTATLDPDDDPSEVWKAACAIRDENLEAEIAEEMKDSDGT